MSLKTDCIDHGYRLGVDCYSQRRMPDRTLVFRHRLAYAEANGLDEATMGGAVLHSCDNRRCVNPRHLSLGTKGSNNSDRASKLRSCMNLAHHAGVLTEREKLDAIARYIPRCPVNGCAALAREYGINHSSMWEIVTGKYCKRKERAK